MLRTFTFDVLSNGYKIYVNGNPHADIVQTDYMPFVDNTLTVGTVAYYTKCAELQIADLQAGDIALANTKSNVEILQEQVTVNKDDIVNAMVAITEIYETIL